MFSHLTNLYSLDLRGNSCTNKDFSSLATIENELGACGTGYDLTEQLQILQNRHEEKFESINEKLEEREKKVDRKLELLTELFYNVDERNEENANEIKEIKKTVDKIWDMLNTK
jgi:hypothetical protein